MNDAHQVHTRKGRGLSCIGLFSGCGGLDLGLERAGFRVLAAMDADPTCALSYSANFRDTAFIVRRIGDLSADEFAERAGITAPGELDLLAGGPPCPAFSKSRFYLKEKPRALDDPVAKETVGGYLRMLKAFLPKTFILENVKGMTYGVHREALDTILATARELGYQADFRVVNAADFGVPQIRERCLIVGSRVGPAVFPAATHSKEPLLGFDYLPWVTAGEVLRDLDTEENASDEGHFAGGQHHELLRQVPPGQNYLHFTKERGHPNPLFQWRSRYWSFLLKLSPSMPSWTIQARRSNNMGPFHWRSRILRISEIKRLQTFPDDFLLHGNIEKQWRQVGNAVPPKLARAFGDMLAHQLEESALGQRLAA